MKIIGLLSLGSVLTIFYFSENSGNRSKKIILITLFTSMPFIPFQALLGMENFLFSTFLLYTFFDNKFQISPKNIIFITPILFLLRFEGILLLIYFFLKSILKK